MRFTQRFMLLVAVLATLLASFAFAGSASAAPGGSDPVQAWLAKAIAAQQARKPGGVVSGNTLHYADEDVTLTFNLPASLTGGVSPYDYMGCSSGEVCLYTQPNLQNGSLALSTGSLWCPLEQGANDRLKLWQYGLDGNVRSVDSENGFWGKGVWYYLGFAGGQWTLSPHGTVLNASPNHIEYVEICRNQGDFQY